MTFTSKQVDTLKQMFEAKDAFVHAFGQDYPTQTAVIEAQAVDLADWADGNPVPEAHRIV